MVIGYVLINTEMKCEKNIYEQLAQQDGVEEVQLLAGEFDLIAKVESADHNTLGNYIINNIRNLNGITRTTTLAAGYTYTLT